MNDTNWETARAIRVGGEVFTRCGRPQREVCFRLAVLTGDPRQASRWMFGPR